MKTNIFNNDIYTHKKLKTKLDYNHYYYMAANMPIPAPLDTVIPFPFRFEATPT